MLSKSIVISSCENASVLIIEEYGACQGWRKFGVAYLILKRQQI
jgi:hypothetical protein